MKNSRLIAIITIAALSVALTACSGNEANPAVENQQDESNETVQQDESNELIDAKSYSYKELYENAPIDANGFKDTPVRVPTGIYFASFITTDFPLRETVENADIIADITIVEWLGEDKDAWTTFFRAKVNSTFKGGNIEEVSIIQQGYSKSMLLGVYPLFKNGDRFLVFLEKANYSEDEDGEKTLKDKYWITGGHMTRFDVLEHENETYLLGSGGSLSTQFNENEKVRKIEGELGTVINEEHRKFDPVLAEVRDSTIESERRNSTDSLPKRTPYDTHVDVFNYNDVVDLIAGFVKDGER